MSDEQKRLQEREAEVAAILESLMRFEKRETEDCPHCGAHVERLEKVGRCVYSRPCCCRLWQGTIPAAWKGQR